MKILKKPPNDEFTLRLFFQIDNQIPVEHDAIYLWSLILDNNWEGIEHDNIKNSSFKRNYKLILENSIKHNLILIGIKDHLTSGHFNPLVDKHPHTVEYLINLLNLHKDKKFVIFTSLENLDYYLKLPNIVSIIPWGGDIVNQYFQYRNLDIEINKNFNSEYTFLSLNRNYRYNRLLSLGLIFGFDLENNGLISCMFKDNIQSNNFKNNKFEKIISKGLSKISNFNFLINDDYVIYPQYNNDNVFNFKNSLVNYYKDTFIEIICETSYTEKCFLITEKTQNSIFGCNFPIWISSQGTVKFLREMGLDVFDDIIDHSYDLIEDPVERACTAINSNLNLLRNNSLIKKLWKNNLERFIKNISFIKNDMYEYYKNRSDLKFKNDVLKKNEF